jgi:hypothetical protein
MNQAIASGAVDFVGLARLLAIEPDAPNKLLSGKTILTVKPIKTGFGMVDRMGLMETAWYSAQLKRIGKGEVSGHQAESVDGADLKLSTTSLFGKKKPARLRAN